MQVTVFCPRGWLATNTLALTGDPAAAMLLADAVALVVVGEKLLLLLLACSTVEAGPGVLRTACSVMSVVGVMPEAPKKEKNVPDGILCHRTH